MCLHALLALQEEAPRRAEEDEDHAVTRDLRRETYRGEVTGSGGQGGMALAGHCERGLCRQLRARTLPSAVDQRHQRPSHAMNLMNATECQPGNNANRPTN